MNHKIIQPHPDLEAFVKCYWTLEIQKEVTPKINTIVPDGCIKMIFHYGDKYKHHNDQGESSFVPRCLVVGQLT